MTTNSKPFRVLCIDGGGMRGLYTCAYLSSLVKRYENTRRVSRIDVGKGFGLITGTSTGAIIASAVAAGVPLERVADLYRRKGPAVFPAKLPRGPGPSLLWQLAVRPWLLGSGASALAKALRETFGNTTIQQIWERRKIALAIPAVEMSRHHAWVFKTPHLPNSKRRDDEYRLAEVCLAATAAPVYRSMARLENPDTPGHQVFVDGGLWANSPVLVGLVDALALTSPGDSIEIYCLGTCPRPEGELVSRRGLDRGLLGWRFGGAVVTLGIDAQEYAFHHMARMIAKHVDRDCRIVRFPHGKVPASIMQYLDLDETRSVAMDALVSQAQKDVSETLSRVGDDNDVEGRLLHGLLHDLPVTEPSRGHGPAREPASDPNQNKEDQSPCE